jgi:hypothetical protein
MTGCHRWCRRLGRILLLAGLLSGLGCFGFVHPIGPIPCEQMAPCRAYPSCCRDHVYLFIIHGMDPCDIANLGGVRDYIQALGFRKTYYGQIYHTSRFEKEIRRIHQEDPSARFVLIGFSFGANMVRYLANQAQAEGIDIDLMVYLGGNTLNNEPRDQPDNVGKIVNILASGAVFNGAWMDRAENIHETDVFHFGTPSHPWTLDMLARELTVVAGNVSVFAPGQTTTSGPSPAPVPRGEWDFLKPVSRLDVRPAPK